MITRIIIFAIAALLSAPSHAQFGRQPTDNWHKTVTNLGKTLTTESSQNGEWLVEYNSKFSGFKIGTLLSPLTKKGGGSTLNVVKTCSIDNKVLSETNGQDFGATDLSGSLDFSTKGSAIPPFISDSLSSLKAGLALNRTNSVKFSFDETKIQQLEESDAADILNQASCFQKIKYRKVLYLVRGILLTRLNVSQGSTTGLSADADVVAAKDIAQLGFLGKYGRNNSWSLQQKEARPWFRIVSKYVLNNSGTAYELEAR